ncbi:MAG: hypothetical protein OXN25_09805 [Candidatus Poribacteria bacterium]|nr:hypothetical protein [Candidatus Poribacteria bacterium]MYK20286.1 hypothetical protein [Candidatus Poribacteria bacterium]
MLSVFNSKTSIIIGCVAFILLQMLILSFAAADWELVTQLPTERVNFATAVVDNKVYLIGGSLNEDVRALPPIVPGPFGLSTVDEYDPQTNRWRRRADMPTPRHGMRSAVVDGIIYVFGGYNAKDNKIWNMKLIRHVEAYNPKTNRWIKKGNMPVSRIGFDLGVIAGRVYLIGGSTGVGAEHEVAMSRVDVYNPATDMWGKAPDMPTRRDPDNVAVVNNSLYVIGGWPPAAAGRQILTVIEAYDPINHQWEKKQDMLAAKFGFSTIVIGDEIYLIGGVPGLHIPRQYLATVDVYHPRTETWRDIPSLPVPMRPFGAVAVNGKIYVFGGVGEGWEFFPDVLVFDTGFRAVEATGKLLTRWGGVKGEPKN